MTYFNRKENSLENSVLSVKDVEKKQIKREFKEPNTFLTRKQDSLETQIIKSLTEADEKNPYAIGMSQAMKSTGDTPPLKKSTIVKGHDIAKSIKKDMKEEDDKYKQLFKKELEKSGKGLDQMSADEKKSFFNKIDKMYSAKNETHTHTTNVMNKDQRSKQGEKEIINPIDAQEELSAAQKKLPPALQKAIAKKSDSKENDKEVKKEDVDKLVDNYHHKTVEKTKMALEQIWGYKGETNDGEKTDKGDGKTETGQKKSTITINPKPDHLGTSVEN